MDIHSCTDILHHFEGRPPSNTQPQAADGCIHYDTSNGDLAAADVVTNVHQDDAEMVSMVAVHKMSI